MERIVEESARELEIVSSSSGEGRRQVLAPDEELLPRDDKLDGSGLTILPLSQTGVHEPGCIMISDGERTAAYVPVQVLQDGEVSGKPSIIPAYTEAGWFCEAQCVTIQDGTRISLYVPCRVVPV